MTYAKDDIRSQLATAPAAPTAPSADAATPVRPAQYLPLYGTEPDHVSAAGSRTWLVRGQHLVLAWTEAVAGDRFPRTGQPDEYAVLMYSAGAPVRVTAAGAAQEVAEEAFVVVPPGDSTVEALADGPVVRVFSTVAPDLAVACANAAAYAEPDPRCAPLVPWPDPVDGYRLRVYRLADHPIQGDRFGRIFRTTNMMINFLAEEPRPRDPLKLSPHVHDDFEQLSLAVKGEFVHHIQYPWGPDSTRWRPDDHGRLGSPSVCVIPPPAVHTTQGVGPHQQLIDMFAPPRYDFSGKPGWIRNAADYPMPS
ncbi:hypothetical protein ABZS66_43270 [Dactylosporangium sp. NPDC005572]|uniref:hypothetical protein n=1 Tax=Dactylosporangium sp. NPDC005572 TaxID=3156889 RepID=UPI00339EB440